MAGTVTYAYSGDQKRRSRSVSGGAMTKYRVDQGWGVVNEENSGGTLLSTYVHHPQRQIGTVLATSEGSTASSGTWNYYFQDAIGSTRGLWDEDGHRLGKYDYTPFGGKYGNTGEEITRKFTGHDWDSDARLYYTAYRYYSPDMGRWLTRDPLGMVDGPNVYAYVMNNPVSMWDALGQDTLSGSLGNLAITVAFFGLLFMLQMARVLDAIDDYTTMSESTDDDDTTGPPDEAIEAAGRLTETGHPGPGWTRGGPNENWTHPEHGSLRPDFNHAPPKNPNKPQIPPHVDWHRGGGAKGWRIFPDGTCQLKP